MFHLVSRSARIRKFWRFPLSCFHNDSYNLDIPDSLNRVAGKKYRRKLCWEPRKMFTAPFSAYFSCHPVVRLQRCWQLIHVQMSGLPGWQSGYIKLTFPSVGMTGCSESRQQSCHKQLSALTIIRFIYWQRSGRTTSWKASSDGGGCPRRQTGRTTRIIRRALTLISCCQSARDGRDSL